MVSNSSGSENPMWSGKNRMIITCEKEKKKRVSNRLLRHDSPMMRRWMRYISIHEQVASTVHKTATI